ncbi:MAG: AMP-binding protein [Verrucomicrobiota bacterium]
MLPADFWTSEECHIAINPHRREDADGLAEWAAGQGMQSLCFFQTSGSEGTPKWVALTKDAFLISGKAVNEHFAVTREDVWLIALPQHHVGGFAILARAHLSGSRIVHDEARWDPERFVGMCTREGITLVSLVPAQVHDLVRERFRCPPRLRAAIIGGGGMSRDLALAARELGWPVFQSYGMTEAASQVATQPLNESVDHESLQVLPHWQVQVDGEARLKLSGPALARGYASRQSEGSWQWQSLGEGLVTRDRVRLWEFGGARWLAFVGRESGFVKILGELVHLAPLQSRLESLALAHGAAYVPIIAAVPDARRESRLLMVVEDDAGAALLEGFNACTEPLCQISETVKVLSIPRSPLGKVDSKALQALLCQC